MYFLLVLISFVIHVCSESPKHYILKQPVSKPSVESPGKHDSVGATYQAITKRHYSGEASSATTAEILNTVTSPHSSASVSFTATSVDHQAHPEYPHPLGEYPHPTPPTHQYNLQNIIVNDLDHAEHEHQLPRYQYRFGPNDTLGIPTTPRVSPKAFSYQPVITLSNNMKTFYKVNAYTPFVVPPNQYYADLQANSYLSNLIYPSPEPDYYKYPDIPTKYLVPGPVVSYNVSGYPSYESTPAPAVPHAPLVLPSPDGFGLIQGVPKPYRDNAYLEPERPLYRPALVFKKYAS